MKNTCTVHLYKNKKIIKYKKNKKNSGEMDLPSDESLSKDETVLRSLHCSSGTCLHEHISPLLGEHPRIVNFFFGSRDCSL